MKKELSKKTNRILPIIMIIGILPFTILKYTSCPVMTVINSILWMTVISLVIFHNEKNALLNARFTFAGDIVIAGSIFLVSYVIPDIDFYLRCLLLSVPLTDYVYGMATERNMAEAPQTRGSNNRVLSIAELLVIITILGVVAYLGRAVPGMMKWSFFSFGAIFVVSGACWMLFSKSSSDRYGCEKQFTIAYLPVPIALVSWWFMGESTTEQKIWSGVLSILILAVLILDAYRIGISRDRPK